MRRSILFALLGALAAGAPVSSPAGAAPQKTPDKTPPAPKPPAAAAAQPAPPPDPREVEQGRTYDACMRTVATDPSAAFEEAGGWRARGGGFPARHCAALALVRLKQYRDGAERLEALAQDMARAGSPTPLVTEVLAQGGRAWLEAGSTERAYAVETTGLKLDPRNGELLVDRAVTLATAANYWEAIDDLNHALEAEPRRIEAMVLRATAYRYVGSLELAEEDVARALKLDPQQPDALLERGILKRLNNDPAGARADWLALLRASPESPAAEAARDNLAALDVKQ